MSDSTKRVQAAHEAVRLAAIVCRHVQSKLGTVRSLLKDDKSPVTVADFASQAIVAHILEKHLGKVTLVGEEDAAAIRAQLEQGHRELLDAVLEAVRIVWPAATQEQVIHAIDLGAADPPSDSMHGFWTLDPIDGTKGFLRGEQYAVSLAWIEYGSPIIGALACPNLAKDFSIPPDEPDAHGTIYIAEAGGGVFEYAADDPKDHGLHIRRLEPAEDEPMRMCESVESGHTSHDDSERVLELLGEAGEPVRLDSQAKYAVVGRGQADLYLRLPRGKSYVERIWDHAAGSLVAREAGCSVTDIAGNELDFSHGKGLEKNRGIVVAPPRLHGKVIAAIARLGLLES